MGNRATEVDAYIAKSPEYSRPILVKIRDLYHDACPDVTESIKWGHPFFSYEGIIGNMPAFKNYVRMSFWHSSLLSDHAKLFTAGDEGGLVMLTSVADLPGDDILISYIKEAVELNKAGIKAPTTAPKKEPIPLAVPDDLNEALEQDAVAAANFEAFSPSKRKEYAEWIAGAKTEATRTKRIATAVEQIAEGKALHWKYEKR